MAQPAVSDLIDSSGSGAPRIPQVYTQVSRSVRLPSDGLRGRVDPSVFHLRLAWGGGSCGGNHHPPAGEEERVSAGSNPTELTALSSLPVGVALLWRPPVLHPSTEADPIGICRRINWELWSSASWRKTSQTGFCLFTTFLLQQQLHHPQ